MTARWILRIGLFALLTGCSAASQAPAAAPENRAAASSTPTRTPRPSQPPPGSQPAQEHLFGERIEFDGALVTFSQLEQPDVVDGGFMVRDDEDYYTMLVEIENVSNKFGVSYNSILFSLSDSQGYGYSSASLTNDQALKWGRVKQGQTISGMLAFSVPKGTSGLVIRYSSLSDPTNFLSARLDSQPRTPLELVSGQQVEGQGFMLTVVNIERRPALTFEKVASKPAMEYLILDMAIDNLAVDMFATHARNFKLRDSQGAEYPQITFLGNEMRLLGDRYLLKGARNRGQITFEVPTGSKDFMLSFQPIHNLNQPEPITLRIKE